MHMNFLTPVEHDRIRMIDYDPAGSVVIEPIKEYENPFLKPNSAFAELSFVVLDAVKVFEQLKKQLLDITYKVIEICPDRRVVHLAGHGRTWRTRKKNVRRAFKILEKERCRACPKN